MIELPPSPQPNSMEPTLLDYGSIQRGAASLRVDRPGSRYMVAFTYPPMQADMARKFTARLQRAKSDGIRVPVPLLGVSQGIPGAPVVDGAGQAGKTLAVRGLTARYIAKEGFWLTIIAVDGSAYLHTVAETAVADATGKATISIEPALRAPFADGDSIELAKPYVEGFIDGESWGWSVPVERLIAVGFSLEEYR